MNRPSLARLDDPALPALSMLLAAPEPLLGAAVGEAHGRLHWARLRWWMPGLALFVVAIGLFGYSATTELGAGWFEVRSTGWWVFTTVLHLPYFVILFFLAAGLVERVGFYFKGRAPETPGRMPSYPKVCVQVPMFNEHAVARRVIEAAAAMTWPTDRLTIQVLDDSTDEDTRALVEQVCAEVQASRIDCHVRHRFGRLGYKAGALEEGRKHTDAEFLVIFDADFLPPADYLLRTIPHFFHADGTPDTGLALVQAQWGHLNHDESALTLAQSLWVDDHHTLQMSWRSAMWKFVNFTGTAGVWRASAIEEAGGWRAASLVEDCELSFRHLFAGYRTKFVKEIVVPAELPATYSAYKAQQKRWTQGWVQLQRLHLKTLFFNYRTSRFRKLALLYHMCIPWQWPAWAIWITTLPFLIYTNHWFGAQGTAFGVGLYLAPTAIWLAVSATVASFETKHTYSERLTPARFLDRLGRVFPYVLINTGMLPHQFTAFVEGVFGPLHSEFERTPKAATVTGSAGAVVSPLAPTAKKTDRVKVHWPYVLAEMCFAALQIAWTILFASAGLIWCAVAAGYMAACVLYLALFYGDHAGKVCFVLDRTGLRFFGRGDPEAVPSGSNTRTRVSSAQVIDLLVLEDEVMTADEDPGSELDTPRPPLARAG